MQKIDTTRTGQTDKETHNNILRSNSPGVFNSNDNKGIKNSSPQKGKWNKLPRSAFLAERHKR